MIFVMKMYLIFLNFSQRLFSYLIKIEYMCHGKIVFVVPQTVFTFVIARKPNKFSEFFLV